MQTKYLPIGIIIIIITMGVRYRRRVLVQVGRASGGCRVVGRGGSGVD